jgi:hypothetical protein
VELVNANLPISAVYLVTPMNYEGQGIEAEEHWVGFMFY